MSRARGRAAAVLLLLGALFGLPCSGRSAAQEGEGKRRGAPRLLLHDWFGTSPVASPTFVRDHLEYLESLPFDGLAIYLRSPDLVTNVTAGVFSGRRLAPEEIDAVLRPVAGLPFRRLLHNFAAVINRNGPDLFDDWSGVVHNFEALARASRDARLEGLYIDNENYGSRWLEYPSGVARPQKTLGEYQDQARLRGRQIMEAVVRTYPDITVLFLHGPYLSEPKAPHPLFPDWARQNPLTGAFFAGFVEGAGAASTLVDGGELYHLRSAEDFEKSYVWRARDFPSDRVDAAFLPPEVRSRWSSTVTIGFGLYDRPVPGAPMDPEILRGVVERALVRTDRYVWLYIEGPTWLLPSRSGGAPAAWVAAVREGREAAFARRKP